MLNKPPMLNKIVATASVVSMSLCLSACMPNEAQDAKVTINKNPYPSTYQALPQQNTLFINATILTGTGQRLNNAEVLFVDGKIVHVGSQVGSQVSSKATDENAVPINKEGMETCEFPK